MSDPKQETTCEGKPYDIQSALNPKIIMLNTKLLHQMDLIYCTVLNEIFYAFKLPT